MMFARLTLFAGFAAFIGSSCAGSREVTLRDLPVGLKPIEAMLEGCDRNVDDQGGIIVLCSNDVVFKYRDSEVEEGSLARYYGDGVDLANSNAGRMIWGTAELKTAYDRGVVDRGEVRAVDDDHVVITVLGAVRKREGNMQNEASCQSPPQEEERCTSLLTAYLDLPVANQGGPKHNAGQSQGAVSGRSISLPTSCRGVEESANHGRYSCDDGARLYWMTTTTMEEAAEQAAGAVASFEEDEPAKNVGCAILDGDAQCQETPSALVALGYVAGRPLVVVCLAPDPWAHGVCRSIFRKQT